MRVHGMPQRRPAVRFAMQPEKAAQHVWRKLRDRGDALSVDMRTSLAPDRTTDPKRTEATF